MSESAAQPVAPALSAVPPPPASPSPPAAPPRFSRQGLFAGLRVGIFALLALAALTTPGFLSAPSLLALLTTVSFVGCVAVGMTLITISGNIMSFSLGATAAASAVVFVTVLNQAGLAPAVPAALATGALIAGVQGFLIGWLRANPIIVSIAALALIYGVSSGLTRNATVDAVAGAGHELIKGKLFGVPVEFAVFLAILALGQLLLSFTIFGRNLFLVGSGLRAAEAAGLRSWRTVTAAYLWAGAFTAAAGIMLGVRYNQANMEYGLGYDYDAIAAVLVGGTAIQGGHGSMLRTLAGVAVIAVVQVVLLLHGLRQEWQYLIAGVITLLVVMSHASGRR
jgi:ribose/xylose/arabinose/galactoside ABC-type transport system permease subunit